MLFENVGVRYGAGPEIIHGATFTLAPGSFHFLVGPSGAGKSSLLRLMYMPAILDLFLVRSIVH